MEYNLIPGKAGGPSVMPAQVNAQAASTRGHCYHRDGFVPRAWAKKGDCH